MSLSTAQIALFTCVLGYPSNPPSVNISLESGAYFNFYAYYVDVYDCPELELHWEILRADGETELYTVVNDTYRYHGWRYEQFTDRGIEIEGYCYGGCDAYLWINPTDLRYDRAQITAVLDLPGCFNSSNSSDTMTLNIQGYRSVYTMLYTCSILCMRQIQARRKHLFTGPARGHGQRHMVGMA